MSEALLPLDTRLPALLKSGKRLRGIFNGIASPAIVEMCAYAGFDFMVIDNEHGSASIETTENMLRAARASNLPTLVQRVKYPLASGANTGKGISGQRGSAFSSRAAGYGTFGGPAHTQRSNDGIALMVMIETPEGVTNAESIAAVEGVDGVFIGPNDLAYSMSCENRWNEAVVQAAIERTLMAVAAAGKCPGILALSPEDEDKYAAWGARYFASVSTGIITRALKEAAQGSRQKIAY